MRGTKWTVLLLLLGAGPAWPVPAASPSQVDGAFRDFDEMSLGSVLDVTVTTAARHEQSLGEAPNAVSVITAEEIQAFGYETLADALRGLAGMQVSNDRNYEYLGIRGFAPPGDYNTRVLVLVDGHPINDVFWSYAGVGTDQAVDLSVVDRIEVLRGPGSALYGTNAIFGTINVITREPADLHGLGASAGAGSFGCWQGEACFGTPEGAALSGIFSFSAMNSRGPDLYFPEFFAKSGDGPIRGRDGDEYRRFYATVSSGPFSIRALHASRTKEIPTAPWNGIIGDPATASTDGVGFVDAIVEHPVSRGLGLLGRVYVHSSTYDADWPWFMEDSSGTAERHVDRETDDGFSVGAEGRLDWRPNLSHRILAGAELRGNRYKLRFNRVTPSRGMTEDVVDRGQRSTVESAYVQEEFQISRWIASTIGGHYDHYATFGGELTPRLALVLEPTPRTRLKALYGEGFKAPSYGESQYGNEAIFQIGNPDIQPEHFRSGELIVEQTWSATCWTRLSSYVGQVSDQIKTVLVDADGTTQYQNAGRATVRGIEFDLRGRLPAVIELSGNLTRQEARTLSPDAWAPNSPRWMANLGLHRRMFRGVGAIGLELRYVGDRRGVHEGTMLPAHLVADTNLLLPLPLPGVAAAFKIRNIGDQRYSDPGGEEHAMPAIEQDGRTWRVSLTRSENPKRDERS